MMHSLSLPGQTDLKSVLKKIACDEAVFAPQLACSYLAVSAYIESPGDWEAVRSNVQKKVRETEGRTLRGKSHHHIDCARSQPTPHTILRRLKLLYVANPNARRDARRKRVVSYAREAENRGYVCTTFVALAFFEIAQEESRLYP